MSKALGGTFLVLLGIALAARAVGILEFNIFFSGWWTLFIIVPSAIGLVNREKLTSSLFGLGIGILLLAFMQGLIKWDGFIELLISLIFVVIGISFLTRKEESIKREKVEYYDFGSFEENQSYSNNSSSNHRDDQFWQKEQYQESTVRGNDFSAFLSGRNYQFINEIFSGGNVTSILGNVQLDLRNAILNDDVIINVTCMLGGVDVYIPRNARVVVNCTPIFGGLDNKVITPDNSMEHHTIFIRGTCILGGIEVK